MNKPVKAIRHFIKDWALWFVWVPLRYVIQYLPLKFTYQLSTGCAYVFFLFASNKRRMMAGELQKIFKDKHAEEINRIVKQGFDIYVKRQVDNLVYGKLNKKKLEKMVSIEGKENLDAALAKRKGVIILLSHFGSFLMVLPTLGFMGYHINQLAGPPLFEQLGLIHKKIFLIRKKAATNLPVTFLQSDQSLFTVVRALKNNECVAIAFDGRAGEKWIPVRMLGLKASVSPGPVRIAIKTGSVIIPTFMVRQKNNTHRLIIEKPFELEHLKDSDKMVSKNTQKLANIFEKYIQEFPSHYGMTLLTMRDRVQKGIIDFSLLQEEGED